MTRRQLPVRALSVGVALVVIAVSLVGLFLLPAEESSTGDDAALRMDRADRPDREPSWFEVPDGQVVASGRGPAAPVAGLGAGTAGGEDGTPATTTPIPPVTTTTTEHPEVAASAMFDPSFGDEGFATVALGSGDVAAWWDVVRLPGGRTLLTTRVDEQPTVVRLLADGRLDPAFGSGGMVRFDWGREASAAELAGVMDDGRIVAFVVDGETRRITRLLPDGSVDASFGNEGHVDVTGFQLQQVLLLPAGDVVAVGHTVYPDTDGIVATRFDAAGAAVPDWGGVTPTDGDTFVSELLAHGDGFVLVGATPEPSLLVARLDADGQLDLRFGAAGYVRQTGWGDAGFLGALVEPSTARIVTWGYRRVVEERTSGFIRVLHPDGSVDETVGDGGTAVFGNEATGDVLFWDVAVDAAGRFVVTGSVLSDLFVGRFLPDGTLDSSFAPRGYEGVLMSPFPTATFGSVLLHLDDGSILVGGSVVDAADPLVVARVLPPELL